MRRIRRNLSGWTVFLCMSLLPLLSLADPGNGNDCTKHPDNPGCSVAMPEHWSTVDSLGLLVLVLLIFWLSIRFKVLRSRQH
jgi:hypothetical protein